MGVLIWKGDNVTSERTYLSQTDGIITDFEIFYSEGKATELYPRYELE